jgi:uncharacterized protein (DUF697 family)/GTP-binding protein EngB required for normal cell division
VFLHWKDYAMPETHTDDIDLTEKLRRLADMFKEELKGPDPANILLAGMTGVGKSTLINAVFGEELVKTGRGRPVTQRAEWVISDRFPIRLLDTKGIEAKDYKQTLADLTAEVERTRKTDNEDEQLHIAWICISEPSSRVQPGEIDLVKLLNEFDIPVIVVLTKHGFEPEFHKDVSRILSESGARVHAVVPVRALPAFGLDTLVDRSYEVLPEGRRTAFVAMQRVKLTLKRQRAQEAIVWASAAAAAATASPVPLSDAFLLVPIQIGMLLRISSAYGLTLDRSQMTQIGTSLLGCIATTLGGRLIVGSIIKLIPGFGSLAGTALNATVAATLTSSLGEAYASFLYSFIERTDKLPVISELLAALPSLLGRVERDGKGAAEAQKAPA